MNISTVQSAAGLAMLRHTMQSNAKTMNQLLGNLQQTQVSSLDNDGDHDHGAPDSAKGQHIDIRA